MKASNSRVYFSLSTSGENVVPLLRTPVHFEPYRDIHDAEQKLGVEWDRAVWGGVKEDGCSTSEPSPAQL